MRRHCESKNVVNTYKQLRKCALHSSQQKEVSIRRNQYSSDENIFTLNTLFSTIAIASDATLYSVDAVYMITAISVIVFNFLICITTVLQYDISQNHIVNMIITLIIVSLLLLGQIIHVTLGNNEKLLIEVKMVFGDGQYRYNRMELVNAAASIYNCWWGLFLTLSWIFVHLKMRK
ncbi:unnamed protein product [Schistosoma turkestanicum]|nr:unnamed protein product [Schistosoma turkestanicum]